MIEKRVLVPARVRRPPREGFSWLDRRFVREHLPFLSRDAILLYFFLAAVSDKSGLSFYADATTATRLRLDEAAVARAREELRSRNLVAFEAPLTQILALPELRVESRGDGPVLVSEILRRIALGRGQP